MYFSYLNPCCWFTMFQIQDQLTHVQQRIDDNKLKVNYFSLDFILAYHQH